jgi:hypothetical protein
MLETVRHLRTTAIASSLAVYAFCLSLGLRVTEDLAIISSAPPLAVLYTMPPLPTILFLAEALITISTCLMLLVLIILLPMSISAAALLSKSYSTTICLCYGSSAYGLIVSIRFITLL